METTNKHKEVQQRCQLSTPHLLEHFGLFICNLAPCAIISHVWHLWQYLKTGSEPVLFFLKISLQVLHLAIKNMFCLRVLSCWIKICFRHKKQVSVYPREKILESINIKLMSLSFQNPAKSFLCASFSEKTYF